MSIRSKVITTERKIREIYNLTEARGFIIRVSSDGRCIHDDTIYDNFKDFVDDVRLSVRDSLFIFPVKKPVGVPLDLTSKIGENIDFSYRIR